MANLLVESMEKYDGSLGIGRVISVVAVDFFAAASDLTYFGGHGIFIVLPDCVDVPVVFVNIFVVAISGALFNIF